MRIPVFVSAPTHLSDEHEAVREALVLRFQAFGLEPRALGRSDYPADNPLREVRALARHCAGGVILGFPQFTAPKGVYAPGTGKEASVSAVSMPSPWNHLEGGLMVALGLPLLVFRSLGISGGMFDNGVGDYFVQPMPSKPEDADMPALSEVIGKWSARVQTLWFDH